MRCLVRGVAVICLLLCASPSLWSAPLSQDQKEGSGTITGRVTVDGKPAQGVIVMATAADSSVEDRMMRVLGQSGSSKATTDSDGRYRLMGLSSAKYEVSPFAPALVYAASASERAKQVPLGDGETAEDVNFSLVRGGVITGKITDPDGRPMIAERVWVKAADKTADKRAQWEVDSPFRNDRMHYTDDRGIYRIYGLSPGQYTVSAGAGNTPNFDLFVKRRRLPLTFYPGVGDATKARAVDVTAGGETAGIDIRLGLADKNYSVSGRVMDGETRQPVSGALVIYQRGPANPGSSEADDAESLGSTSAFSTASSKGEFKFDSVGPGHYEAVAHSLGELTGGTDYYSERAQFDVRNGNVDNVEIKVHRGANISGIAVVEDSDDPEVLSQLSLLRISASTESASQESSNSLAKVSADGSFRLGGLRAGRTRIVLAGFGGGKGLSISRIEGELVNRGVIDLQPNQQVTGIKIVLVRGSGVIRGHVLIQGARPPSEAHLSVRAQLRSNDRVTATAGVDGRGDFLFENLPPGDYDVEVTVYLGERGDPSTRTSSKQVVTVTNEAPTEVTIRVDSKSKG